MTRETPTKMARVRWALRSYARDGGTLLAALSVLLIVFSPVIAFLWVAIHFLRKWW